MRFTSILILAGASVSLTACGKINHMQETTDGMAATTTHMSGTTDHMATTTDGMASTTNKMSKTTDKMSGTTEHMSETTDRMATTTEGMSKTTNHMSETTDRMATTTEGMSKTTNHMSETTDKMATTTENMSKTTDKMSVTTEHMNETTCTMYASLRQGNTKVSRDTDMAAIRKGKNITEKLELAAKYMQGFEYQVWSPVCVDIATRESVIEQSATELLTAVQPFIKDRSKVGATSLSSDKETLYALAATLHRTNDLQASLLKGSEEKPMTMEEILLKGIELDRAKNAGTLKNAKYPAWATAVGKYEKDAEYLLRLRANFLMAYAYAIADGTDFGDSAGFWKKLKDVKLKNWAVTKWLYKSSAWKPNLAKRTATEIRERITTALELALATRTELQLLGIDPMVDPTMLKVWKNADFSELDLAAMDKAGAESKARADAIRELIATRGRVLLDFSAATK